MNVRLALAITTNAAFLISAVFFILGIIKLFKRKPWEYFKAFLWGMAFLVLGHLGLHFLIE